MFRKLNHSLTARLLAGLALLWCGLAQADSWWSHDWSYRKLISLEAGAAGAALSGDLGSSVVLVRLHEGVFKFSDANPDGSDLRFVAEDDKTPLKYHVEKFDPVFNLAFVWVQVPAVKAGTPVKLWMYYGNAKAGVEGSSAGTYDSSQLLVYHFDGKGVPPVDATNFKHNATSAVGTDEGGLIGNSARFDGNGAVSLPASPSLNLTAGTMLTWSAWVKIAAPSSAVIYSQRDASGAAFVVGAANGSPYVAVAQAGLAPAQTPLGGSIADDAWHHLAVVAAPQLTLYVDGAPTATLAQTLPTINASAVLGGAGFAGEIDELQIAKVAREPAAIRLAAVNQGTADKLVSFGGDEAQSGAGTGYFGIILKSLTLDAWVCIVILLMMMMAAFYVMWIKGRQIGRAFKGNAAFLEIYHAREGDMHALHEAFDNPSAAGLDENHHSLAQDSPLMKVFNTGSRELQSRLKKHKRGLSAQSLEAIRASLHGTTIRETQALNRLMVLLTIAISGGPFIGLLGTVMGVMITFASVAAAGDVNINAIAPGISAALAATVTGLGVAIPSLFGYNYLLTRSKECSTEMQVFVDEFVTRIAENHNDAGALAAIAQ